MSFNFQHNGRRYRIQFRLAVLCQLFLLKDGDKPRCLYTETVIHNPMDDFNLYHGAKLGMERMIKQLRQWHTFKKAYPYGPCSPSFDFMELWRGFLGIFKPWVKI